MAKDNVCPYCGAQLAKNATHCEHCLHELESVARQRHEDAIEGLQRDRRAMKKTLPKKIVAFFSHKLAIVIVVIVLLALIGTIFAIVIGKVQNASGRNIEEKQLELLEEYYTSGQYEELAGYVRENYVYGYKFEKYTQVADAYYYYMELVEEWDYYKEMGPKVNSDSRVDIMYWVLYYGISGMRAAESGYADKGLLGNETLLEEIYEAAEQFMIEEIAVNEDEIKAMLALEALNKGDIYPYSDAVVTRLGDR